MKLLFDQNLSYRLPVRLADLFRGSTHVRTAGLDQAPDHLIWAHATANDYCIVSQDSDFAERSRLFGSPPKVIWLRCGNSTPAEIEGILRRHADLIGELERDPALDYVELWADTENLRGS